MSYARTANWGQTPSKEKIDERSEKAAKRNLARYETKVANGTYDELKTSSFPYHPS